MSFRQDISQYGESSKERLPNGCSASIIKTQYKNLTLPRCFTSRLNEINDITEDVCLQGNIGSLASKRGRYDEASYRLQVLRVT